MISAQPSCLSSSHIISSLSSTPRNCLIVRWVRVENVLNKVIWQPQYKRKVVACSVNLTWHIWRRNLYESAEYIIDVLKRFSMHIATMNQQLQWKQGLVWWKMTQKKSTHSTLYRQLIGSLKYICCHNRHDSVSEQIN